jgi:hypothetical protein
MRGDPYKLLYAVRSPSNARVDAWPEKVITAHYNERNTVTTFCVWDDDGKLLRVPRGMEDEAEALEELFGEAVRACPR